MEPEILRYYLPPMAYISVMKNLGRSWEQEQWERYRRWLREIPLRSKGG